jgi:glycosyltransferase involved in cell wall biosynthesis
VVTPCFEAASLIRRTAESIMAQTAVRSGRLELEYIVVDGASRDRTVEIVREVCGDRAQVISEPDAGMYDALAKGLRRATGDVVSYLDAGDLYAPAALDVVADVMEEHPEVQWLTGMTCHFSDRGALTYVNLPYRFRRGLLRKAAYGRMTRSYVSQESTFWARTLHDTIDMDRLATFDLAGDSYLWHCFASRADLVIVEAFLGGFTHHRGQKSEDLSGYHREMALIGSGWTPLDHAVARVDRALTLFAPPMLKKALNRAGLLRYRYGEGRWS